MSVTTNIYYKGENGSAKAFAEKNDFIRNSRRN